MWKLKCSASVVAVFFAAGVGATGNSPAPITVAPKAVAGATANAEAGGGGSVGPITGGSSSYKGSYYGFGAPGFANGAQCPMGQFPFIGGTYGWEWCMDLFHAEWLEERAGKGVGIRYLCSKGRMEEDACKAVDYKPY